MSWSKRLRMGVVVLAVSGGMGMGIPALGEFTGVASPANALPTGKEVLEKYLEKTGGRAAYEKLTSRVSTGKLEVKAAGISATTVIYQNGDGKVRVTMDIKGMGLQEQGFDGTNVWEVSPMTGARLVTGEEREQFLGEVPLNSELKFAERFASIENVGEETIEGKATYHLVLKPKTGAAQESWYDKETGLLVKTLQVSKSPQGEVKVESYPTDWRTVDGVLVPFATRQVGAGAEYVLSVEKVEHNVTIAPEKLAAPEEVQKLAAKAK